MHGHAFIMVEIVDGTLTKSLRWFCKHCDMKTSAKPMVLVATSSLKGHLEGTHGVTKPQDADDDDHDDTSPSTPSNTVVDQMNRGIKRLREASAAVPEFVFQKFKKQVIK